MAEISEAFDARQVDAEQRDDSFRFRILLGRPTAEEKQLIGLSSSSIGDDEEEHIPISPLDPTALSALLSRLPERNMADDGDDPEAQHEDAVRLRGASLALPQKSGMLLPSPFPPPPEERAQHPFDFSLLPDFNEERQAPPLHITRFTPATPVVDHTLTSIALTFSQPMVAMSDIANVMAETASLPISLMPQVEGSWRWFGTQTVQFQAKHRFPFSTTFKLTVEKGCKSTSGSILRSPFSHAFSTLPPSVVEWSPTWVAKSLSPFFFLCFNQRITPSFILSHISVSVDEDSGEKFVDEDFEVVEEPAAEKEWPHFVKKEVAGMWVAFRLREKLLKRSTSYVISVPAGCPSAEGNLTSTEDWSATFCTYGPLVITSSYGYATYDAGEGVSKPIWTITFSNELDHTTISKSAIDVSPSIEDFKVSHNESTSRIVLKPVLMPDTTYLVTLDTSIKDVYGQHLESSKTTAEFEPISIQPVDAYIAGPASMIIVDPSVLSNPFVDLMVFKFSSLRIQVLQVDVEDYRSPDLPSSNKRGHAEGKNYAVGKAVYDQEVEIESERLEPHGHKIFLGSLLQHPKEHLGQLFIIAEPTERAWKECQGKEPRSYSDRDIVSVWVQCTELSLDVFPDQVNGCYTAWVSSLESGIPIGKATVRIGTHSQDTDEDGLAIIVADGGNENEMIIVRKGLDTTFVPDVRSDYQDHKSYGWYVFDSRGLYKPTEEVHIKGHIRKLERKKNGGQQPVVAQGHINYVVYDARRNKLAEGDVSLMNHGSFYFTFSIPDNSNLGIASVDLQYKGEQEQESSLYRYTVKIEEFRKPEFEIVTLHSARTTLYAHPSKSSFVIASTSAKYYAGGPLTGAEVRWTIQPSQTQYAPPGHSPYKFGSHDSFLPRFWGYGGTTDVPVFYPSYEGLGKTNIDGKHEVKIEFRGIEDCPSPISISAHASVIDINNQVQESATTFLVHPSYLYVGYKLEETYGRKGKEVKGEVIVCDVDGKLVNGVDVNLAIRGQGKQEKEDDTGLSVFEDILDEQTNTIQSDKKPVNFVFIPRFGGVYSIVFSIVDSEQRCNESRCNKFLVSGSGSHVPPQHQESEFIPQDQAELIPNKEMYEAGETAVVLVESPFWPAEGLLVMKHWNTHVGDKIRFRMQDNSHTIPLRLDGSWTPAVEVQVLLVGSTSVSSSNDTPEAEQLHRPAFAVAQSSFKISSAVHRLAVDITPMRPEETATPGGTIHVTVSVKTADHKATVGNAEICLIVVDEAILNLGGYSLSDPLSSFYPAQYCDTSLHHLRKYCLMPGAHLVRRQKSWMGASRHCLESMCAKACMQAAYGDTIRTRSNFNPLAAFFPSCSTDVGGFTELTVELPDNLTRYRIWAVAATEMQFGFAESSLSVELPIMIRPSPPRFLNLSDSADISVVLQNQTKQPLPVQVGMRKNNDKVRTDTGGFFLTLPSFRRAVVSFPVSAVDTGDARLQFVTSTLAEENVPPFSDASDVVVPVFTPVSSEFFATYGDVAKGEIVLQPIKCPSDVFPHFGGLDVSISSTTLQSLTDALLYLYTYPFECNEQLASRIIGFLSLWEVLEAFNVKEMPSKENTCIQLHADLQRLKDRQLSYGGWAWWTPEGNANHEPFISLHVACALVKASKVEVLRVDGEMFEKALEYCATLESHLADDSRESHWLPETKYALSAYALYVQALSNKDVGVEASALLKKASLAHLTLEACGWILVALGLAEKKNADDMKVILDYVKSRATETGEYAHFTASYKDDGMSVMLHSNRRTDAILLEALLIAEPSCGLCVKVAKGLQAHRKAGKWGSTQENCFVLVALNRFLSVYEKEEPNFTANVWLGEQWVTSHTYAGRSIETKQARVSMPALLSEVQDKGTTRLIVQKEGGGRLYYRIGLGYAPRDFQQKAASYGLSILRSFEGVESPMHAVHDTSINAWKFKVGEKIRVKLTLGTSVNRYHVAMVDCFPAGCEPINPALERSEEANREQGSCIMPANKQWWVEHENMRDERVEAFCSFLRPGQYEYCYVLRATCKGTFLIPPAKVEEMYAPENFGRCASEKVTII